MLFRRYSGAASYTDSRSYESFTEIAEAKLFSSAFWFITLNLVAIIHSRQLDESVK